MFSMKSIKKRMSGMLRNKKGFTLIEIIAVLVILAILAVVAIPRYGAIQDKAKLKATVGATTELIGRCSIAYAGLLIDADGNTTLITGTMVEGNINTDVGTDFNTSSTSGAKIVTVTATYAGSTQSSSDSYNVP